MSFANVIVDISHEKLDKPFQYIIPTNLIHEIQVGSQVEIPFGKSNRMITGYVIEVTDIAEYDIEKMKKISGIKKGSLKIESQLIALAFWMKQQYGSTMNRALKTVIPIKKSIKAIEKKYITLAIDKHRAELLANDYALKKNTIARSRLLKELIDNSVLEDTVITQKLGVSNAVIKAMNQAGYIKIDKEAVYRNPIRINDTKQYDIELNEEQQRVVNEILEKPSKTHLIFGVTGSGKTEVYMELIEHTLKKNQQAIVLIPEIALTYQTIKRFYSRFGDDVTIINSRLSEGEKYDAFERAKKGEIHIMIGPRSALFTPFRNLGLIIIDEEHEGAYKSDQIPKYHARETAIYRAKLTNATVVLGSATPSVTSYYKAMSGEFFLHKLQNRANEKELPIVHVVDLRKELENGNRSVFSELLVKLIKNRLEKKEQIMLFINRRGYSSFVSCRSCGKAIKCPHCDVTLTFHKSFNRANEDKLVCHYCGYSIPMPKVCPTCSSKYLGRFGIGTQQIEDKVHQLFGDVRTLRMDFDTTKQKGNHEKILSAFSNGEADILIGTQMIVKGHDFPNVTLVGVIAADLSLYASDYLANERTFELLTQAAGRAGRGDVEGEVVIQTYNPDEMSIITATNQDYESFYQNEISYRKLMEYPPVYSMVAILIADKREELVKKAMADISRRIEKSNIQDLMIIGPSKATLSKVNDVYRYIMYLKHIDNQILINVKDRITRYMEMKEEYSKLSIQFDFAPMSNY